MLKTCHVFKMLLWLSICIAVQPILLAQQTDESAQIKWLQQNAHSFKLESDDFADLEFLKPLLKGKRLVQLGENTHGAREYSVAKARIVQYLHKELGYEVLAFESDIYQCYTANLTAETYPAFSMTERSTMIGSIIGVWHTKEVLPVFEYIRQSHSTDAPLQLAGFDVQPIGNNKTGRPKFLSEQIAKVDAEYAKQVLALDQKFLEVYAGNNREQRAFFRTDEGQAMAKQYDRLATFLKDNAEQITGGAEDSNSHAVLIARQTAASMATYIRQQSSPTTRDYFKIRDKGMADNLVALVEEMYPDKKVIVWGHNFHIRHDNLSIPPVKGTFPDFACETMGQYLHDQFGDQLYTVGFYAYEGSAANNRGQSYQVKPANAGSIEKLFHDAGFKSALVDLSKPERSTATQWMFTPVTARYNGQTPLKMIPQNQYDAILFIDKITPREMLY